MVVSALRERPSVEIGQTYLEPFVRVVGQPDAVAGPICLAGFGCPPNRVRVMSAPPVSQWCCCFRLRSWPHGRVGSPFSSPWLPGAVSGPRKLPRPGRGPRHAISQCRMAEPASRVPGHRSVRSPALAAGSRARTYHAVAPILSSPPRSSLQHFTCYRAIRGTRSTSTASRKPLIRPQSSKRWSDPL
jgi:hypothetical protein